MARLEFTCPHCTQHLEAPEEAAGVVVTCPACQQSVQVPVSVLAGTIPTGTDGFTPHAGGPGRSAVCAICQSPVGADEAKAACPACHAEYHADCWHENGGCAVYGCKEVPVLEPRRSIEIPVSFWGRENKPCPACGREILAAAVRCRHCGATFSSARPEETAEFEQRASLEQRLPEARRTVIWIFVLCVIPCLAPVGAVWGAVWYPSHREEVRALPSLYAALCRIGLGVAIILIVTMVVMALLYSIFRSS